MSPDRISRAPEAFGEGRKKKEASFVTTEDGRQLAYEVSGAPLDGKSKVVFLLHGLPGSRVGPKPRGIELYRKGITLVTYDRPGFGLSDRKEGRTVADAAEDVRAIADNLGVDTFTVVGRSGGGPHALACAALMPNRVQKAISLAGMAPRELVPDYYKGMTDDNKGILGANRESIIAQYRERAARISEDSSEHIHILDDLIAPDLTETDRAVTDHIVFRRLLSQSYLEGIRNGEYGMADDAIAFAQPWGFDVRQIQVPVAIWSGTEDRFTPYAHAVALAQGIPGATLGTLEGYGHFAMIQQFIPILTQEIATLPPSRLKRDRIETSQAVQSPTEEHLVFDIREHFRAVAGDRGPNHLDSTDILVDGVPNFWVSSVHIPDPLEDDPRIRKEPEHEVLVFRYATEDTEVKGPDGEVSYTLKAGDWDAAPLFGYTKLARQEVDIYHQLAIQKVLVALAA